MATSNAHRVGAFLLALLFLVSTIAFTGFIIWNINQQKAKEVVNETPAAATTPCGSKSFSATPRQAPAVTSAPTPVTQLEIVDVSVGDGETVQAGDCVAALYYGTIASTGNKFETNYDTGLPVEFSLNGVIKGWQQGIPGMKVGGVRRLVIPASLAYGDQANEAIPANSDLVFEVVIVNTRRGEN